MLNKYGKSLVSFVLALSYLIYQLVSNDGHLDGADVALVIAGFGNAALTYLVPLAPERRWLKTAASALVSLGTGLLAVSLGGFTADELVAVLLGVAQFLGVAVAPAISNNGVEAAAGIAD